MTTPPDKYFTDQHVAGTRAGAEGYQAMSTPLTQYILIHGATPVPANRLIEQLPSGTVVVLSSAADAALAEVEQTIAVHADVLAETIHKHEQRLATVEQARDIAHDTNRLYEQQLAARLASHDTLVERLQITTDAIRALKAGKDERSAEALTLAVLIHHNDAALAAAEAAP